MIVHSLDKCLILSDIGCRGNIWAVRQNQLVPPVPAGLCGFGATGMRQSAT